MKNKLSALEQLRYDRAQLETQCSEHETRLTEHISYLGENWGSLLLKSIFSVKSKPSSSSDGESGVSAISSIAKVGGNILPVVWSIAQPYLIGMATNKIKNLFMGNRKKKKNSK